jgi:hypothetical protein
MKLFETRNRGLKLFEYQKDTLDAVHHLGVCELKVKQKGSPGLIKSVVVL